MSNHIAELLDHKYLWKGSKGKRTVFCLHSTHKNYKLKCSHSIGFQDSLIINILRKIGLISEIFHIGIVTKERINKRLILAVSHVQSHPNLLKLARSVFGSSKGCSEIKNSSGKFQLFVKQ